ncbi:hypothetical protein HMPREF1212_04730 [Parabacteroides sp. HGS0025]|uniref:hypothetical protein n=1 Tax=Parabacteroides sp. HGS0025 TaxID=1078087 RepID=UPI00061733C2|nr:hypothetical protein [Parabacteroides sp. HGS0025]KKB46110.1 hypothetical protein HMPREF1212_04730 [Parabacteroides sp. HGS0025]MBP9984444.1 hypothetical protein [Prevotella sp.]
MEGLEIFKEAFEAYSDNYVIIGGTACDITMQGTVVRPRATHDIDMTVIVENMTPSFAKRFWEFVKEAGYRPEKRKQIEGEPAKYELYRFVDGKTGYPEMIELLSRHPDILGEPSNLVIEPLPIDGDVSSLSAIIMDDDFYHFTIKHSKLTDGVRHADSAALVCLKTRAYLNLLQDKAEGKHVNSKDIKKHRSDVLKNVVIITDESISAPMAIVDCVKDFVSSIRADWDTLSNPLAKALDQDQEFVDALLEQLNNLFVPEQ